MGMGDWYSMGVHRGGDGGGGWWHVVVGHRVMDFNWWNWGRVLLLLLLNIGCLVRVLLGFNVGVHWLNVGMRSMGNMAGL